MNHQNLSEEKETLYQIDKIGYDSIILRNIERKIEPNNKTHEPLGFGKK